MSQLAMGEDTSSTTSGCSNESSAGQGLRDLVQEAAGMYSQAGDFLCWGL